MAKVAYEISFLFLFFGLFMCSGLMAQVTIWEEDFTYADGTVTGTGSPSIATWEADGIDLYVYYPYSRGIGVLGSQLISRNVTYYTPNQDTWQILASDPIEINGYSNVTITMDISATGFQPSDSFRVEYQVDAGSWQTFETEGYRVGNYSDVSVIAEQPGLAGDELLLRATLYNDNDWKNITLDNIEVIGTLITSAPDCTTPASPSNGEIGVAVDSAISWYRAEEATDYKLYFGTDLDATNIENGTDLGADTSYVYASDFDFSTTYYWYVVPSNSFGEADSCDIWSFTTEEPEYCSSYGYTSSNFYFTNVALNTINNSSGNTSYGDYTSISTSVDVDSSYTVTATFNMGWTTDTYVRAWVDWNRDADFDDANESFDIGYSSTGVVSGNITVPSTALSGKVRMRLTVSQGSYVEACATNSYHGEVEDYSLNVIEGVTQLSPPIIGTITQPTCGTNTGSVVLSGLPSGVEWEITRSPDSVKYYGSGTSTTITDLNSGTYTFSVDEKKCPGTGVGLTANYYNTKDLSGSAVLTRIDTTVAFSWGYNAPESSVNENLFSVRWTGQVLPCYTETYTFRTLSDDGIRLWVDGDQVINNWTDHGSTYNTGTIDLEAGIRYDIILEFYENYGGAVAELEWSSASLDMEYIPKSQLFKDDSSQIYMASGLSDEITIALPPVTIFNLTGGGNYCLGSDSVELILDGSELDVSYQLYLDGLAYDDAQIGTGSSLSFTGLSEGTYTVVATHSVSACSTNMDGDAIVIDMTPSAPTVGTITQPSCLDSTGSVVLSGLPSQWQILQTPGDTSYYGVGDSATISGLGLGSYSFSVAAAYSERGLMGEYFNNMDLSGTPVLTRTDTTIDFDLGSSSPAPSVVNANYYSVHWSGYVQALYDEEYTFGIYSDDGIRMWVDGVQLINNWTDHASTYNSGTIVLEAGEEYEIIVEFYEKTGESQTQLYWSSASQNFEIIPKAQLYPQMTDDEGCFSVYSELITISSEHVTPIAPDSLSVDRSSVSAADTDSITLTAFGGLGNVLRWYTGACAGTEIGTDTSLTLASPDTTTLYYALWETSCGQSACLSVEVKVINLSTDSVTSIGDATAKLYGSILAGDNIDEYGFFLSLDNNTDKLLKDSAIEIILYQDQAIDIGDTLLSYTVTGLVNRSAYYFRSFMKDADDNYFYGNVVRFISEKRDFSLALDGSGDCLVIDEFYSDSVINDWGNANNTFSLEFWMKKGSALSTRQVLCEDYAATAGYVVALNNGYIALEDHSGTTVTSDLQITDEEWHHIAVTYDNGVVFFFVDDSISSEKTLALTRPSAASNCFIGSGYNGASLESEFNGHIDALRFWNVALTQEQVSELLYDLVQEGASNTVQGVGSGNTIPSLAWSGLTASLGFNVMSTMESSQDFPASFDYNDQTEMHDYPFFHSDARLGADSISFNVVAVGNARPSPYLPRVYWRNNSSSTVWQDGNNWSAYAYPGEGATVANYPDVASSDMENDSAYCKYTIVSISNAVATVTTTPPEVQVLVDRDENIGTYYVDESTSELWVLQGIRPEIFGERVEDNEGAIIVEEGAMEVLPD